ncbi:hypothetical protein C0J52_20556 [Blattella germanica]|nr:hypothetical protein C0J52_20556 [Blattella germanica]
MADDDGDCDISGESVDCVSQLSSRLAAKRPAALNLEPLKHSPPNTATPVVTSRAVNLSFSDLSYSVKTGIKRG